MNKTAILLGSSNPKGNTSSLIDYIAKTKGGDIFDLKDYQISPYDYQHRNIDDDFIGLINQLLKYDTIVFASPVYWYTMSAQMKVFFDRLSDLLSVKKELGRLLKGKTTAVIATGATEQVERSFEEVFTNSFKYLSMNYKGMLYCFCEDDFKLDEHKASIDTRLDAML
jgi:multimeric flavodoxin WrbA